MTCETQILQVIVTYLFHRAPFLLDNDHSLSWSKNYVKKKKEKTLTKMNYLL